jgi:transcription initiation factor TFIIIB Brf1 subunit/transcription initiation factor TFIIB
VAIVQYIIGGNRLITSYEDSLQTCENGFHSEIFVPDSGEIVCDRCGLVLDVIQIEFEPALILRARPAINSKKKAPSSPPKTRSRVEAALKAMLNDADSPAKVNEKSFEILRSLRKQGMITGCKTQVVAKALFYTAHKMCSVPLTITELVQGSALESRKILRCYNQICKRLDLRPNRLKDKTYLDYLVKKRNLSSNVETPALVILKTAKERRLLSGANRLATTASALYLASNKLSLKVTQKEMANASGVSEVTIRSCCRILRSMKLSYIS